jgi:hypothetical protein
MAAPLGPEEPGATHADQCIAGRVGYPRVAKVEDGRSWLGGPVGLLIGLGASAAVSAYGAAQASEQVRALLKPTCAAVGPAVGYDGWDRDTHQFTFLNREYADAFSAENVSSLVSLGPP